MTIHISGSSLMTTIQDLGRIGYQKFGVNVSGAMDRYALRLANILTGNPENEGALEITLIGPKLSFDRDTLISLTGADLSPAVNGVPVPRYRPIAVRAGAVLTFGRPKLGCRAYLAAAGGFDVPQVMGSKSTYARAGFGGYKGRLIQSGDAISTGTPAGIGCVLLKQLLKKSRAAAVWPSWAAGSLYMTRRDIDSPVRFTEGLQYRDFSKKSRTILEQEPFTVTVHADRMGYRLEGPKLSLSAPMEMISEMAALGTIQVPPEGYPIILMADHQSCAGYPEIGQVLLADMGRVAQFGPKQEIHFKKTDRTEAEDSYMHMEKQIRKIADAVSYYAR